MKNGNEFDQKENLYFDKKIVLNNKEIKTLIDFFSLLLEIDKREKIIKKYET